MKKPARKAQVEIRESDQHFRPIKRQLTMRIDSDVLAWLRSKGPGYLTRVNAILREEMLSEKR